MKALTKLTLAERKRDPNRLTLQEIGLQTYIERHLVNGLFDQKMSVTADNVQSSAPTIHRVTHKLIDKEYLTVVHASERGKDGWNTELVVKPNPRKQEPIPPVKVVENKEKPIPRGIPICNSICRAEGLTVEYGVLSTVDTIPPVKRDSRDKPVQPAQPNPEPTPPETCGHMTDDGPCWNLATENGWCTAHGGVL